MENASNEKEVLEFYIDDDQKLAFPTLANSVVTNTDELCKMAKIIFSNFEDYHGISVNFNPNSFQLNLCVHFAQIDHHEDGKYYAFENSGNVSSTTQSGLRRILQLERTVTEGNKFTITEQGKQAMEKYMSHAARDEKGNVKWNALGVITQFVDSGVFGQPPVVCNVINLVSPVAVLRELFGSKIRMFTGNDENGNATFSEADVDYEVVVMQSLQQPTINGTFATPANEGPFKIDIRQINKEQLKKSAQDCGMNFNIGRHIVK